MTNEMTKTAPAKLWLCVSDEEGDEHHAFPVNNTDEVCWAADPCPMRNGVEYMRSDLYAAALAECDAEITKLRADNELLTVEKESDQTELRDLHAVAEAARKLAFDPLNTPIRLEHPSFYVSASLLQDLRSALSALDAKGTP